MFPISGTYRLPKSGKPDFGAPTSPFQGEVKKGDAHWSLLPAECSPLPQPKSGTPDSVTLWSSRSRKHPTSAGEGTHMGAEFFEAVGFADDLF
jgi:hypothetical protein